MTWASTQAKQRIKRRADRSHGVGHGRQRDRHAFQRITLGLPVQRLMLAELLEQDHGQQARPRPSSRDHMERRRRLADLLAVPAGELLPHRLDHFPLTRQRFQRSRHVFAELAQAIAAAAFARRRRIDHHPLARKVVGERVALGALARKSGTVVVLATACSAAKLVFRRARFQLFEGQRQLVDQPRRALRSLPVNLALQLRDPQASAAQSARRLPTPLRALPPAPLSAAAQRSFRQRRIGAISIHETK